MARFAVATDADGDYHLVGLAPGRYRLTAHSDVMSTSTSTEITIAPNAVAGFDLHVPEGTGLEVVVRESGAPILAWGALLRGDRRRRPATT
jgi:hypothetical protein